MNLNRSEIEQQLAFMRDHLPRVWWNLYQGSLATGFDQQQAMVLVQAWILSQCPAGIRPGHVGEGPRPEET
jgi:hypothetical protein